MPPKNHGSEIFRAKSNSNNQMNVAPSELNYSCELNSKPGEINHSLAQKMMNFTGRKFNFPKR